MQNIIKVMIVDDSAYFRFAIKKYLEQFKDIEVICSAKNGLDAIEKLKMFKPDVISLDIEMPQMNGIELLKYLMVKNPIPTIMLTSLTPESTDVIVKSLEFGAVDFINKEAINLSSKIEEISDTYVEKIRIAAQSKTTPLPERKIEHEEKELVSFKITKAQVIAIGCSTGGPKALQHLVPHFPANLPAGIIIVQHMPANFTKSLAQRLDSISRISVKEAEDGDLVLPGRVLIAPGNYHMEITSNYTVKLNQNPAVNHVRPAVDVLLESLPQVYDENITAVILTGMGHDGLKGCETVKSNGGYVIAEDEKTCTIYGMPKAVIENKVSDEVLPLDKIVERLVDISTNKK